MSAPTAKIIYKTGEVANGATDSSAIYIGHGTPVAFRLTGFDGAATMTFKGSQAEDGTFSLIREESGAAAFGLTNIVPDVWISFTDNIGVLAPFPWVKFVCGAAQTGITSIEVLSKE